MLVVFVSRADVFVVIFLVYINFRVRWNCCKETSENEVQYQFSECFFIVTWNLVYVSDGLRAAVCVFIFLCACCDCFRRLCE